MLASGRVYLSSCLLLFPPTALCLPKSSLRRMLYSPLSATHHAYHRLSSHDPFSILYSLFPPIDPGGAPALPFNVLYVRHALQKVKVGLINGALQVIKSAIEPHCFSREQGGKKPVFDPHIWQAYSVRRVPMSHIWPPLNLQRPAHIGDTNCRCSTWLSYSLLLVEGRRTE